MPIWNVAPVDQSPEVVLRDWTIMEVTSPYWDGPSRHFIGYNVSDREGRVSSQIVQFDAGSMCGVTRSGRVYKLMDSQGYDSDAGYVWQRWKEINHVETEKDVSGEVCGHVINE